MVQMNYSQVQKIAKDTIAYAMAEIKPGMNLQDIRRRCEEKMLSLGASSFWYWDVGAFVFSGDETAKSVSGREYKTSDRLIADNDIITIDLSPQVGDTWGDFARTLIVENGSVVQNCSDIQNTEWKAGLLMEEKLHAEMQRIASPQMSFEELYYSMNDFIRSNGYINLDFLGNLGHSIVRNKDDRIYIEKGNHAKLGDVSYFTFEPHISTAGSVFGYKRENIYYFEGTTIREL